MPVDRLARSHAPSDHVGDPDRLDDRTGSELESTAYMWVRAQPDRGSRSDVRDEDLPTVVAADPHHSVVVDLRGPAVRPGRVHRHGVLLGWRLAFLRITHIFYDANFRILPSLHAHTTDEKNCCRSRSGEEVVFMPSQEFADDPASELRQSRRARRDGRPSER